MIERILQPVSEHVILPHMIHAATAAAGTFTTAVEFQTYDTYDFDQTSTERISFGLIQPYASRWGATVYWTAASGTGGVVWALQGNSVASGANLDAADGFASTNGTTFSGAVVLQTTELPIVSIWEGQPSALINATLLRTPNKPADTLNADAQWLALVVRFYV